MKKILILLFISFTFLTPTIVLAGDPKPTNPGEGTQEPKDDPVDPGGKPDKPDNP